VYILNENNGNLKEKNVFDLSKTLEKNLADGRSYNGVLPPWAPNTTTTAA